MYNDNGRRIGAMVSIPTTMSVVWVRLPYALQGYVFLFITLISSHMVRENNMASGHLGGVDFFFIKLIITHKYIIQSSLRFDSSHALLIDTNMTDYELRKLARYIVEEMSHNEQLKDNLSPDRILDVVEAANELRISPSYLRNNYRAMGIPHKKVGKRLLFSLNRLTEYMNCK